MQVFHELNIDDYAKRVHYYQWIKNFTTGNTVILDQMYKHFKRVFLKIKHFKKLKKLNKTIYY